MFTRIPSPMLRSLLLASLASLACGSAYADSSVPCPQVLGDTGAPVVQRAYGPTQLLCFRGYAVMSSHQLRSPLWSAERLTVDGVMAARQLPRDSDFYEEPAIPPKARAALSDYARSGFDRGHLAPSGNFPDKASQAESFSLANVVPQDPLSNRRLWSHIETSTRRLVRNHGVAYVVTGPAFDSADPARLRERVAIPRFIWKAIYIPGLGAAAYVARNDGTLRYAVVSISDLTHFAGVAPFPKLSAQAKETAIPLPAPTPHPGEKTGRLVSLPDLKAAAAVDTDASDGVDHEERHRLRISSAIRLVRTVAQMHF